MSTVDQIMTRQLFHCTSDDSATDALEYLRMLNIHAAPVFEGEGRAPVGIVALSDLTGALDRVKVVDRMSSPVVTVLGTATVTEAAELIVRTELHHLIVANAGGNAIGFVSAVDIIRAQLGWAPTEVSVDDRPPASLDLDWSGDEGFTQAGLAAATDSPGVFVLTRITDEHPPSIIWADTSDNVRADLQKLLADPPPRISRVIERGRLHFRTAPVPEPDRRREVLRTIVAASAKLG